MDKAALQAFLEEGLSLEQIGRRVGRDPSTVGYWVKKHGLQAAHHDKHTGKLRIARETLEALLEAGCSYEQAARTLGVSQVTCCAGQRSTDSPQRAPAAGRPQPRRKAGSLSSSAVTTVSPTS